MEEEIHLEKSKFSELRSAFLVRDECGEVLERLRFSAAVRCRCTFR